MVFDWKNNKEEALANGIKRVETFGQTQVVMTSVNGAVEGHTFRNFPELEFEDGAIITGCTFEDCGTISAYECNFHRCTFRRVEFVFSVRSKIINSKFCELICDNDMLISLEDSELKHCTFDDIELRGDSYLCDGVGDSWIKAGRFSNIRTSRADKEIANCEETVGKVFKKKKKFCIIEEDSCTGLDSIQVLAE